MSLITVNLPSIGRAVRSGSWKKLGRAAVADRLKAPQPTVGWPVGTLMVTVEYDGEVSYDSTIDDPAIQELELAAVWDAEHHLPARLTADFGAEEGGWSVGGSVFRERQIAEERARRWPDQPWHQLPSGWVPTG